MITFLSSIILPFCFTALWVRKLQRPCRATKLAPARNQSPQDSLPYKQPAHGTLQPRFLSQLHLRDRIMGRLHRDDSVFARWVEESSFKNTNANFDANQQRESFSFQPVFSASLGPTRWHYGRWASIETTRRSSKTILAGKPSFLSSSKSKRRAQKPSQQKVSAPTDDLSLH